jgi:DNA repair photolyase
MITRNSSQGDSQFGEATGYLVRLAHINMNLYRGCQHQCFYCDSRSECYQIENSPKSWSNPTPGIAGKRNSPQTHQRNDRFWFDERPYMPWEADYNLTGQALQIIAKHPTSGASSSPKRPVAARFPILKQIAEISPAVTLTITTADDELAKLLEPGAHSPTRRFHAIRTLAENGILCGVTMMPILPFIEDSDENIIAIVEQAYTAGAKYIIPAFGMTCRDRQRDYFYDKLDRYFPGLRQKYEARFGNRYGCESPRAAQLERLFQQLCQQYGIARRMLVYQPDRQMDFKLF